MRKFFIVSLSLIFFISACGTTPTPSPTPIPPTAVPPTTGPPPSATPTSATAPTDISVTPTPSGGIGACTDAATFVEDVTIPDYSHLDAREAFKKTWRIKNSGTCTWSSSYSAVYANGDKLNGPNTITFTNTAPGATMDLSVDLTSPNADGQYKLFYQLENPAGKSMPVDDGASIWTIITVGKVVVYATAVPPTASGTTAAGGTPAAGCVTQANPAFLSQTFDLINAARATNGLPTLTLSSSLAAAAQAHSVDMACTGNLSHTGSDGSTSDSRIAAAGYTASITRENIYAQPPQYGGNPQSAMDWWMNSQIHRDAILNSQITQVGVGYASYSASPLGGYFTLDFGAP